MDHINYELSKEKVPIRSQALLNATSERRIAVNGSSTAQYGLHSPSYQRGVAEAALGRNMNNTLSKIKFQKEHQGKKVPFKITDNQRIASMKPYRSKVALFISNKKDPNNRNEKKPQSLDRVVNPANIETQEYLQTVGASEGLSINPEDQVNGLQSPVIIIKQNQSKTIDHAKEQADPKLVDHNSFMMQTLSQFQPQLSVAPLGHMNKYKGFSAAKQKQLIQGYQSNIERAVGATISNQQLFGETFLANVSGRQALKQQTRFQELKERVNIEERRAEVKHMKKYSQLKKNSIVTSGSNLNSDISQVNLPYFERVFIANEKFKKVASYEAMKIQMAQKKPETRQASQIEVEKKQFDQKKNSGNDKTLQYNESEQFVIKPPEPKKDEVKVIETDASKDVSERVRNLQNTSAKKKEQSLNKDFGFGNKDNNGQYIDTNLLDVIGSEMDYSPQLSRDPRQPPISGLGHNKPVKPPVEVSPIATLQLNSSMMGSETVQPENTLDLQLRQSKQATEIQRLGLTSEKIDDTTSNAQSKNMRSAAFSIQPENVNLVLVGPNVDSDFHSIQQGINQDNGNSFIQHNVTSPTWNKSPSQQRQEVIGWSQGVTGNFGLKSPVTGITSKNSTMDRLFKMQPKIHHVKEIKVGVKGKEEITKTFSPAKSNSKSPKMGTLQLGTKEHNSRTLNSMTSSLEIINQKQQQILSQKTEAQKKLNKRKYQMSRVNYFEGDPNQMDHLPQVMGTSFGIQLYQPVPTITEEQDFTGWSRQDVQRNIQMIKNPNQLKLINNVLQKTAPQDPDDEKVQLQVDARLFNMGQLQAEQNKKDETRENNEEAKQSNDKEEVEATNASIGISPYNSPPILTRSPSGANQDMNDADLQNIYPLLGKIQSEAASMFSPPQIMEGQNGAAASSASPFKDTITIPPLTLESSHQHSFPMLDKALPPVQTQIQIDINLKNDLMRQAGKNRMAAVDSYSSILRFSEDQNLSENPSRRTIQITNDVQGIRNLYELFQRDPTNPQLQTIIQNLNPQFSESLAMINAEAEAHRSKANSKFGIEKNGREDFRSLNLTMQNKGSKKGKNQYRAILDQLQQIEERRNSNKRKQGSFSTINQETVKLPKVRVKRQSPMEEILHARQGMAARNLAASLYAQFNTQKDFKLEKQRSRMKKDAYQTHINVHTSDASSGYGSGDQAASSTRQVPGLQGSTLYHNSSSGFLSHGLNPNTHQHLSRSMLQDPGQMTQKNFEMGQTQKEDLSKQGDTSDKKSALRWKQVKPQDYMDQHAQLTQKHFPKHGSRHNLTLNTDLETLPQNFGNSVFEANQTTNQDLFTGTQGSIQVGGNVIMKTVYDESKPQQSPQQSPFGVTTNFANPNQMQMALNPQLLQTMQDQNLNKKDLFIDTLQASSDAKEAQAIGSRNAIVTMARNSPTVVAESNQFEYLAGGKYKPEFMVSGSSNMKMNIVSGQNSKTSLSNKSQKKKKIQKPAILVGVSNNMKSNLISPNTGVNITKKGERSPNAFSAILSRSNSNEHSRNDSGLNTTHRYLEEDTQHLKYGHSTLQGNDHIKVQISGGVVMDSIQRLTNKSGTTTNMRTSPRAQALPQEYAAIPELGSGEADQNTLSKSRADEIIATLNLTPENQEPSQTRQMVVTQQTKEVNSQQDDREHSEDDKTEEPALTNARKSQNESMVHQGQPNNMSGSVQNAKPSSILFDDQRGPEKPQVVKLNNASRMSRDSQILGTPSAADTPAGEKANRKSQMSTGMRSAFQQADLPSQRENDSQLQVNPKEPKNQNPFQNHVPSREQQFPPQVQSQNVTLGPFPHSIPPSELNTLYVQQQLQAQLAMNTAILEEQQRTLQAMKKDALDRILQPIPEIHAQVSTTLPEISGIQTGKYEILNPPVLEIKESRQLETKQYDYDGLPNYIDKQPYQNMTYQQRLLHNSFGKRQRMKTEIKGMANRVQNEQFSLLKNNASGIRLSKSNVQSVKQLADKNTVSPNMTMYKQRRTENTNSPLPSRTENNEILQPNFPDSMMIIKPVLSKTNIELPESLSYSAPRSNLTQMASKKAVNVHVQPKEHMSTMYIDPQIEQQQNIDLRNVKQSGSIVIHQNGDLEQEINPKTQSNDTNTRSQINIVIPDCNNEDYDSVPKFSSLNKGLEKKKYVNYLGETIVDRIKKQMPNTMKNKNKNHITLDVNNSSPGYQQNTLKSLNNQHTSSIYFQKKRLSNILSKTRNDKL